MKVKVTTKGIPAAIARTRARDPLLRLAMWRGTEEGVEITVKLVKSFTPVMLYNRGGSERRPGELRESVQGEVQMLGTGLVRGMVWTDKPWAGFVEGGTREHGRARHMFALGQRSARPLVFDNYWRLINEAVHQGKPGSRGVI